MFYPDVALGASGRQLGFIGHWSHNPPPDVAPICCLVGLGEATEVPVEAEEAVTGRPAGSKAPTALIIGINILQRFVVFYSNCQYFDRVFWEGHNLGTGHATKWDESLERFQTAFYPSSLPPHVLQFFRKRSEKGPVNSVCFNTRPRESCAKF